MQLNGRFDTPRDAYDPDEAAEESVVGFTKEKLPRESLRSRAKQALKHIRRGFIGRRVDPDRFVDHLGHEFKTPLASIRSFSEILHDNPNLPPRIREQYLTIILSESHRLESVIAVLLDGMSQPSALRHPETREDMLERMTSAAQNSRRRVLANELH